MISAVHHTKVRRRRVQVCSIIESLPCINQVGTFGVLLRSSGELFLPRLNLGLGAVLIVGLVDLELRALDLQIGIR